MAGSSLDCATGPLLFAIPKIACFLFENSNTDESSRLIDGNPDAWQLDDILEEILDVLARPVLAPGAL